MSLKHKRGKIQWSAAGAVALGLGVGVALLLLGSAVLAWLIISQKLDIQTMGFGAGLIMALASAAGAWLAAAAAGAKRLQIIGIFAVVFFALLLSVTALLFGGQYSGVAVYGMCILGGAGCVALLEILPKKTRVKGRKMRAYR